jgi:hypothetical protein
MAAMYSFNQAGGNNADTRPKSTRRSRYLYNLACQLCRRLIQHRLPVVPNAILLVPMVNWRGRYVCAKCYMPRCCPPRVVLLFSMTPKSAFVASSFFFFFFFFLGLAGPYLALLSRPSSRLYLHLRSYQDSKPRTSKSRKRFPR